MNLVLDMNLSPLWVDFFDGTFVNAVHWSSIGAVDIEDEKIFEWARVNNHIVFTNDLDFGAILAATNANAPSVLQVRTQDLLPETIGERVLKTLETLQAEIEKGVLIILDTNKMRVRMLPLRG